MVANEIPSATLNNGKTIPLIGLGTWQAPEGEVYKAVKEAIKTGYRHIDCAWNYGNEADVGKAITECIAEGLVTREELFITSKLWMTFFTRERVQKGLQSSLDNLGLEYLDLFLIHWPMCLQQSDETNYPKDDNGQLIFDLNIPLNETWLGMEDCVRLGKVKSIGVSNFNAEQTERIYNFATIKPVMNQVECHPYLAQRTLMNACHKLGILVTTFSPLGNPGSTRKQPDHPLMKCKLVDHPVIKELAARYNKNVGQILIKFQVQRGNICIPKSVTPARIASNTDIFDFTMTEQEMAAIEKLDINYRTMPMPVATSSPEYPFKEMLASIPQKQTNKLGA